MGEPDQGGARACGASALRTARKRAPLASKGYGVSQPSCLMPKAWRWGGGFLLSLCRALHPRAVGLALATAIASCAPAELDLRSGSDESAIRSGTDIGSVEQRLKTADGLAAISGLTSDNGLVTKNGLAAINGLSLTNGLKTVNGLNLINGLATRRGLTTVNGLFVNCEGRTDSTCIDPDGLLSRTTGMMKDAGGVTTAQYLIRCALPPDQVIRIRDYTGAFVMMSGEVGLAPEWSTNSCTRECEEKVSACLLALINQNGVQRKINMTAGWTGNPLGTSHPGYTVLESAFFGNLFRSPVEAYAVSGYDHAQTVTDVENGSATSKGLQLRSCAHAGRLADTYPEFLEAMPGCSATNIGSSAPPENSWSALRGDPTNYNKCSFASTDAATGGVPSRSTALECSGPGTSTRSWRFPISTWRLANPWMDSCPSDPYKSQPGLCGCGVVDPVDTERYLDAQGYTCADWRGYDCTQAAALYGYTAAEEMSILGNCGSSCKICPEFANNHEQTNSSGASATYSTTGSVASAGPFFESLGTNGRRCVDCHQPDQGFGITPSRLAASFSRSSGNEPVFRLVDGAASPTTDVSTPTAKRQAYKLLLERGLIRVELGVPSDPEFEIIVVDDPAGYADPTRLSLFRRPLPATTLKTHKMVMWDGRESPTGVGLDAALLQQASSATTGHAEALHPPTSTQTRSIVDFEGALVTAQIRDATAGALYDARVGAYGGPEPLARQIIPAGSGVFSLYDGFVDYPGSASSDLARAAIGRGQQLFNTKTFQVPTSTGGASRTCTSCHNVANVGTNVNGTFFTVGTADATQRLPDMPLYTLRNKTTLETVQVTDPGRALITGGWRDVGRFKVPGLRGLAARPPYFHNGIALTLAAVVDFYDARFSIGLSTEEKSDMVAFLRAL